MLFRSIAQLNAYNDSFYNQQSEQFICLLRKAYIQAVIKRTFADPTWSGTIPATEGSQERPHRSFAAQVIDYSKNPDRTDPLARRALNAREFRRKAANSEFSRYELIRNFARSPENCKQPSKALWSEFFEELVRLNLNPSEFMSGDRYEYDGKHRRLRLTFIEFRKIISVVAPRRKARLNH